MGGDKSAKLQFAQPGVAGMPGVQVGARPGMPAAGSARPAAPVAVPPAMNNSWPAQNNAGSWPQSNNSGSWDGGSWNGNSGSGGGSWSGNSWDGGGKGSWSFQQNRPNQ